MLLHPHFVPVSVLFQLFLTSRLGAVAPVGEPAHHGVIQGAGDMPPAAGSVRTDHVLHRGRDDPHRLPGLKLAGAAADRTLPSRHRLGSAEARHPPARRPRRARGGNARGAARMLRAAVTLAVDRGTRPDSHP